MKLRRQPGSKNYFFDTYINGVRKRISTGTPDRRTALLKAKAIILEMKPGPRSDRIKLREFEPLYFQWAESRKSRNTLRVERGVFKKLLAWQPEVYLNKISIRDADEFISKLSLPHKLKRSKKPDAKEIEVVMTPASINFYLRTVRSIFETARRWNYLSENVWNKVSMIRYEHSEPRALSVEEIRRFRVTLKSDFPHMVPLVDVDLLTGMRRGEVVGLEWADVDFEMNVITVKNTKGKRPRKIPMVPRVRQALFARRELPKPFPYKVDYVTHQIKAALVKAGIPDASLHDLRRSFASYLADVGMPNFLTVPTVGHRDERTTSSYYIKAFNDTIREYIGKVEKKIFES